MTLPTVVTLKPDADEGAVRGALAGLGLWACPSGEGVLTLERHGVVLEPGVVRSIEGVAEVACAPSPHPLVDAQPRLIEVGRHRFGLETEPVLLAGPCSIESREQIHDIASVLSDRGVSLLRGGAFKPRTSPYAFEGHGERALEWIRVAADRFGLGVVTEVMSPDQVPVVAWYADLIQIGSRNMHDFALLAAAGQAKKPVLLKRGFAATLDEWLLAGEHLRVHGAPAVLFCERGVRGFDPQTRFVLDLGAVAVLQSEYGLPVVVDPSHAAGRRDLIAPLAAAALAAGAAGLIIETHPTPGEARSDGPQAVPLPEFGDLARQLGFPSLRRAAGGTR